MTQSKKTLKHRAEKRGLELFHDKHETGNWHLRAPRELAANHFVTLAEVQEYFDITDHMFDNAGGPSPLDEYLAADRRGCEDEEK